MCAPIDRVRREELTADRVEHVPIPPAAPTTPSAAGAPRLQKSCRWRRPQSKGRSCVSGRARRDLRVRGGRGHLSERPGWPSGAPIARGSTISTIAFCILGPPRASPVRSRLPDRTSRGWARGVPLAGCRFPGPAARRLGLER